MVYNNIKELYKDVMACCKCRLSEKRKNIVFGEGNLHADIMFIGEGPGAREDETGRPFVGPAGKLLDEMIASLGLARSDTYIANVVKCRPPNNRDPQPDEREMCMGYLRAQVAFIKPKIIVCLGRIAAGLILKRDVRTRRVHTSQELYHNTYVPPGCAASQPGQPLRCAGGFQDNRQ